MDKTPLVERDLDAGSRLVQALDQDGFPVTAALWNYLPEEKDWRLVIASPRVSERGPREAYAAIQDVLTRSGIDIPLHRISAVEPEERLVSELRIFAGTEGCPYIGSTYLHGTVIGDLYVEAAYVYRAERLIGQSGDFVMWAATFDRSRDVWIARRGRIIITDGFFQKIELDGWNLPQTRTKHGINARLWRLLYVEKRGQDFFGDVAQWTIHGGRLRGSDVVARGVRVEGYQETPAAATPA